MIPDDEEDDEDDWVFGLAHMIGPLRAIQTALSMPLTGRARLINLIDVILGRAR